MWCCVQGWESHQDLSVAPPPSRRTLPSSISQNLNPQTGTPDLTFISWWILSLSLFYLSIFAAFDVISSVFDVAGGRLHLHPSFNLFSLLPPQKRNLFLLFSSSSRPCFPWHSSSSSSSSSLRLFVLDISAFRLCCVLSPSSEGRTPAAQVAASWWEGR